MKNRFKLIVDYRLSEVKNQERVIMAIQWQINTLVEQIHATSHQITTIPMPNFGTFNQIVQAQCIIQSLRNKMAWLNEQKKQQEQKLVAEQQQLKELQIAYEKIKHLHDNEQQQQLAYMQDREQNEQDEIVQLLYHNA